MTITRVEFMATTYTTLRSRPVRHVGRPRGIRDQVSFRPEDLANGRALYNFKKIQDPSVSDEVGVSAFYMARGADFHTYSTNARGVDIVNTAYNYLDLVPKGRDEAGHDFPQFWVRRHDEYDR